MCAGAASATPSRPQSCLGLLNGEFGALLVSFPPFPFFYVRRKKSTNPSGFPPRCRALFLATTILAALHVWRTKDTGITAPEKHTAAGVTTV